MQNLTNPSLTLTQSQPESQHKCSYCGASLRVDYQPRERPDANGVWRDVGGFEIATCDNPDCAAHMVTVTLEKHPYIDLARYGRCGDE